MADQQTQRVAVVTGGVSAMGRSICEQLASRCCEQLASRCCEQLASRCAGGL